MSPQDDDDMSEQPTVPTVPIIPYAILLTAGIEFWQAFELVEHRERWQAFPRELLAFDGPPLRRLAFLAWCVERGLITDGLEPLTRDEGAA